MAKRCDMRTDGRGNDKRAPADPEIEGSKIALLVEGDGPVRKAVLQVLHEEGYRVTQASDVLAAQHLADSHQNIGLLLADFSTRETSGVELARWFQLRFPKSRILITTSSLWELLCETGEREQLSVLVKPFSDSELRRIVRRLTAEG